MSVNVYNDYLLIYKITRNQNHSHKLYNNILWLCQSLTIFLKWSNLIANTYAQSRKVVSSWRLGSRPNKTKCVCVIWRLTGSLKTQYNKLE